MIKYEIKNRINYYSIFFSLRKFSNLFKKSFKKHQYLLHGVVCYDPLLAREFHILSNDEIFKIKLINIFRIVKLKKILNSFNLNEVIISNAN
jgi:hypothetical protein